MSEPVGSSTDAPGTEALGRTALRGGAWTISIAAATRIASLAAQIILGWLLSERDFGLYALAISVAAVASSLRDGGVRQLLVQRATEYSSLVGPAFWMAGALNLATGLALAAAAPLLARQFEEPALVTMLLLIALAQPLGTPAAILTARLTIDLRFAAVALVPGIAGVLRYAATIALALAGMGPLSFVMPLPFVALIEWALARRLHRERLWSRAPEPRRWGALLAQSGWLLVGSLGISLLNLGAYAAIKPFAGTEVVGLYFFAFQAVTQIGMVLSANVAIVLFPVLSRMAGDVPRQRAAVLRSLRQLMLLAALACLGLAAAYPAIESWAWQGKWASAAPAVLLIGMFYPMNVMLAVALSVQQARGQFRQWGLGLIAVSAVSLASAAAGAAATGTATGVAAVTGVTSFAITLVYLFATLRTLDIGPAAILRATLPAWALGVVAAAASLGIDQLASSALHPAARTLIVGTLFVAAFAALVRIALPGHLLDTLSLAPARVRPLALTLLGLRDDRRE